MLQIDAGLQALQEALEAGFDDYKVSVMYESPFLNPLRFISRYNLIWTMISFSVTKVP